MSKKEQAMIDFGADPLGEEEVQPLLDPVDVIRDPLHGDVRMTALERLLMDSQEFQRLRGINQLAMTFVSFPGALHNRFLHSLGTLHVCSQMIATCNRNADLYRRLASGDHPVPVKINGYATLLARLCALLHDLAHVPFGHTLEKEGRVFEKDEWQDPERREKLLLGAATPLAEMLRKYFASVGLQREAADRLREDIKSVFVAKRSDVCGLRYPFVHDLVGNTICADLIDYVQRDMYFCGLSERFGTRFLEYLAVIPVVVEDAETFRPSRSEKTYALPRCEDGGHIQLCRLVLLQYRYNERRVPVSKHDVVAEAIDLVRRRLAVAEKLYFHRTKIIASAMLISAASASNLKASDVWDLTDAEVLKLLESSMQPRASVIARKLRKRELFKAIYRASYHEPDESHASTLLWDETVGAYERFKQPVERERLAHRLERVVGLHLGDSASAVGTVSVYCPDKNMNLKAFDMLVLSKPGATIRSLQESTYPPTQQEIKSILMTHQHLWKIEVLIDSAVVSIRPEDPFAKRLAGAIQREIGPKNEIEGFGDCPAIELADWEQELSLQEDLKILGVAEKVTHEHYVELKGASFRGLSPEKRREAVLEFLVQNGYKI